VPELLLLPPHPANARREQQQLDTNHDGNAIRRIS
jgi:hypothetical protein